MMRGCSLGLIALALGGLSWALASTLGAEHLEEGLRHYWAEEYGKAVTALEKAVSADPEDSMSAFWLGSAIGRRAEQMTGLRRLTALPMARKSREMFEKSVALDPSNVETLTALQDFNLNAPGIVGGSKKEAGALAGRIEAIDEMRGLLAWADYFEKTGDAESAGERYAMAQELDPDAIEYLLGHAGFLARQGSTAASDALLEQALAAEPSNPAVLLAAAQTWIRAKRRSLYPRAKQLLERYLANPLQKPSAEPVSHVRKLLKGI